MYIKIQYLFLLLLIWVMKFISFYKIKKKKREDIYIHLYFLILKITWRWIGWVSFCTEEQEQTPLPY